MSKQKAEEMRTGLEIAVIGMAGRFPGAGNIDQFWNNLKNGIDAISFFSEKEINELESEISLTGNPDYVKAKGVFANSEYFDAEFFGFTPKEAKIMDPQVRVFLECTWWALEDAGYDPGAYHGLIGLYAGASDHTRWLVSAWLGTGNEASDQFITSYLAHRDYLTMMVSYKLNLKGPSYTMQTTCSTSLAAIHLASRALLTGECHMALAGGVSIIKSEFWGYRYQKGENISPDGHCRAFDARADGTVFNDGVGLVVLKRLEDALADKDYIYAVIKGSAINNDGCRKAGFTAPSVEGQAEVIRAALDIAQVEPESIGYIETHGTGTALGDPVEIEGLKLAFNTQRKKFCRIGSLKTNMGHLNCASGVAGFIKTVLALKHRVIPPSLHYESPNPNIDFENSPFYVNRELVAWKNEGGLRRAGVSSFGIGGTNAHVVLEEWPVHYSPASSNREHGPGNETYPYQLILLSAKSESALEKMTENLANYLKQNQSDHANHENPGQNPGIDFADMAYTLQVGRKAFPYRRFWVCPGPGREPGKAAEILSNPETRPGETFGEPGVIPRLIFMFPGLGAQYIDMGRELYQRESVFREEMNRCFEILTPLLGCDIKEILYPGVLGSKVSEVSEESPPGTNQYNKSHIDRTEIPQPILFIFEYALAQLLIIWGIKPQAMIGYSLGEYTAACVSGVFSAQEALELLVYREQLIKELPPGGMTGVPLPREELEPLLREFCLRYSSLSPALSLAIDNGLSCVVAGPGELMQVFENYLKERKIMSMRIDTPYALHSSLMEPIVRKFQHKVRQLNLKKPQIPYISNVTGKWLTAEQAVSPVYWSNHLEKTVRFSEGIKELIKEPQAVFVEIGPGNDLSSLVQRHFPGESRRLVVNLFQPVRKKIPELKYFLDKVGQLWLHGIPIDWIQFHGGTKRHRVPLPTYPFAGQRFWLEEKNNQGISRYLSTLMKKTIKLEIGISNYFYIPSWKRMPLDVEESDPLSSPCHWLVFGSEHFPAKQWVNHLQKKGQHVITVKTGPSFEKINPAEYRINPKDSNTYSLLIKKINETGHLPGRILHLWGVSDNTCGEINREGIDNDLYMGFYSLLYLTRAIGTSGILHLIKGLSIVVVSNDIQDVTGEEKLCPGKNMILGVSKVIPQEHPGIMCRSVDLTAAESQKWQEEKFIKQLLGEFIDKSSNPVVSYRGGYRWVQSFEARLLEEPKGPIPRLKQKGVYLITGGLGKIGLMLAKYLASSIAGRIVLIGRSFFPPVDQWQQWLEQHGENDLTSQKIKKIRELEALGGQVMVFPVDVSDLRQMQQMVQKVEEQWGSINGLIHLAGVVKEKFFETIDRISTSQCQEHFQGKIYGTLVLEQIFRDKKLDFFWLMSSIASVLGGLAFAAYSAANHFVDGIVSWHNRYLPREDNADGFPVPWISVNWDHMDEKETVSAFRRILASDNLQLAVSAGVLLQQRIDRWVNLESIRRNEEPLQNKKTPSQPRPHLPVPYIAPSHPIQQELVEIWENLFGYSGIGIQDHFFELGGDSLKAITTISRIHKKFHLEIPLAEFFKYPTIEELFQYIHHTKKSEYLSLEPTEEKEHYPLSSSQKRLYILHQVELDSIAYNEPIVLELEGVLNKKALEATFQELIKRHESMRTSFELVKGEPVQKIHHKVEFKIEYYDLATEIAAGTKDTTKEKMEPPNTKSQELRVQSYIRDFIRPFDLSQAPLLRVGLIHTSPLGGHPSQAEIPGDAHILVVDLHHIITDGVSSGLFVKESMALYNGETLPPLKFQYKDYAEWQKGELQRKVIQEQERYWLRQFGGEIPVLNLPFDFPRPVVQSFEGDTLAFELSTECTKALNRLTLDTGCTLYMVILAIFNVLLSKLSGQEDIVVGTPIAGRRNVDMESIIGIFVNTLAMRNYPVCEKKFVNFLRELREEALGAFENQDYPYEELVEKAAVTRDVSRNPLFDAMFALLNLENPEIHLPGLILKPYKSQIGISKFDVTLQCIETDGILRCEWEYCTKLFRTNTIERFIHYFKKLASVVIENPLIRLTDIDIITEEEKQQILIDFSDTAAPFPKDKMIHQLFEERVEMAPDHIAVVGQGNISIFGEKFPSTAQGIMHITYRELNQKSHRLALVLKEKNVRWDNIVGIKLERCVEIIIGMLGIVKAGGAYLPIDPGHPRERLSYMLADSGANIVLTRQDILDFSSSPKAADISPKGTPSYLDLSPAPVTSLAYIIYTSGSTGVPKGVMVQHNNFVNAALGWRSEYHLDEMEVNLLQLASFSFDVSCGDLSRALINGGKLIICPEEVRIDFPLLYDLLCKQRITLFESTPSLVIPFMDYIHENHLKAETLQLLIIGSDIFRLSDYRRLLSRFGKKMRIINSYGVTEATIDSSFYEIEEGDLTASDQVPIGKPLPNVKFFILDGIGRLQPIGVPGELFISGSGIARGYLNRAELTAEKFLGRRVEEKVTPFQQILNTSDDKEVYKTGDLARWLPDGNVEFLGRLDHQVKIRGYRIDLAEIENRLVKAPYVKGAAVLARENDQGEKYLCAYIVPAVGLDDAIPLTLELKKYLSHLVPDYMIPPYFITLEKIPLTTSGKINRKMLPEPEIKPGNQDEYEAPRDFIEKKLVEMWQQVLGIKPIGINDNFFAVGGDSIKGVQISARLLKHGLKLEIKDLFLSPYIEKLAKCIKQADFTIDQGIVKGEVELTPIQRWFFENNFTNFHHYNQAVMIYRQEGFDEGIVERVFRRIVEHHDALRMIYVRKGERVIQTNRGMEGELFHLEVINLAKDKDIASIIERESGHLQGNIDLERGPLVHLGLFKTNQGDHVLIVIHHLVVDGISWRILLEDFALGYQQAMKGESIKFQPKTSSFKHWVYRLREYAESTALLSELAYWKYIEEKNIPSLPRDFYISKAEKKMKNMKTVYLELKPSETDKLLRQVNQAYGTEINDILLAGLGMALLQWGKIREVLIYLEGHGREGIVEGIDISRTVGWFTTQFPVLLDMSRYDNLSQTIKNVKETLRGIPFKGIGYEILKYITPEAEKENTSFTLAPEITFNYLGQFDPGETSDVFRASPMSIGNVVSPEFENMPVFDINGIIVNGVLKLSISYNRYEYNPETIESLLDIYRSNLVNIIEHCITKKGKELTPSDLIYSNFSIDELEELIRKVGELKDVYELTPMQTGMLFHTLKDNNSASYFEQTIFSLEGDVDKDILHETLDKLVERYDILRTIFLYEGMVHPLQVVLKQRQAEFHYQEIDHLEEEEIGGYLEDFCLCDRRRGFDLSRDMLIRYSLLKTGRYSFTLTWSSHHILMDGWCLGIIFKELLYMYRQLKKGESILLEPVTQFGMYIKWLKGRDREEGLNYWQEYLEGYEEKAGIPGLMSTVSEGRYEKEKYSLIIPGSLIKELKKVANQNQVTINTILQTIWGILLQKYNNLDDVVYGVVVSGRPSEIEGIESMVGLFINTIPLRIQASSGMKFSQVAKDVQERALLSKPHEYLPLWEIQAGSYLKRELIDHIMIFEYPIAEEIKDESNELELGFKVKKAETFDQTNYDFYITVTPGEPLLIQFNYNSLCFDWDMVMRISGHLERGLRQVIENPHIILKEIDIIPEEEKNRLLYHFNNTTVRYPIDKTITRVFTEQVEKTPDHVALVGTKLQNTNYKESAAASGDDVAPDVGLVQPVQLVRPVRHDRHDRHDRQLQLTYRELNEESARLAGRLIEKGVGLDTIVGIMIERSLEMIIGLLGILKAGGAYLPIDPQYPQERIEYMLKDSGANLLVTTGNLVEEGEKIRNWEGEKILLEKIPVVPKSNAYPLTYSTSSAVLPASTSVKYLLPTTSHQPPATSLAYIIYTSGSTGKPKGVMIAHQAAVNYLWWAIKAYVKQQVVHFPLFTSLSFDLTVTSIFTPLCSGNAVIIYGEKNGPLPLETILREDRVGVVKLTPSHLRLIREIKIEAKPFNIKRIIAGGETLDTLLAQEIYQKFAGQVEIYNEYGPTEAAVGCIIHRFDPEQDKRPGVPIGTPVANTKIFILDPRQKPVPVGVNGELSIAGTGLARGYLNQPELTKEKFIDFSPNPKPLKLNTRIYRTGDLAKWLPDGSIEFLGRIDHQVKIRGFRVELGEIESRLLNHPGIKEAVAIAVEEENGDKYLCAYIASPGELKIPGLREYLAKVFPDYMIPSYFVFLEKIPINPNGKIDRKALPSPERSHVEVGEYVGPRDKVEEKLVSIWYEVLGRSGSIGIDDNFFELGGHSLKATILTSRMHKIFDVRVPLAQIFKTPKIRELAIYIKEKSKEFYISIEPVEEKEYYELSPAQKRLYILQQLVTDNTSYNMPYVIPLEQGIDNEKLESVFKKLIERHESLRTSFITVNQKPFQRIHREVDFSIGFYEVKEKAEADSLIAGFTKPFDLNKAPLLKVNMVKIGSSRRDLFIDMHHIITDGTSQDILEKEFQALQEEKELQHLRLQYKDYSEWNNSALRQEAINRQESYWIKEFSGEIPTLNLPIDYPRPLMQSVEGNVVSFRFNEEETGNVKRIAAGNHSTLYMCLLAVFNVLLSKLSGQEDIIIGTPIAARLHADLQDVIGMFVNTLVTRNYPSGDKPFRDFLKEVSRCTLDAYENQEYPFEVLVDKITVHRDASRNPVFDVMFNLLNQADYNVDASEQNDQDSYLHIKGTSKFDMNLAAAEIGERIFFTLEYSTCLFKPERIEKIIGYFKNILKVLSCDTRLKISEIEIMDTEEKEAVLRISRGMEDDCDEMKTLYQCFEEQAARTPDNIALHGCMIAGMQGGRGALRADFLDAFGEIQLSYGLLNEKSNRLANHLRKKGVGPDSIVGLMVERSLEMIIGMLGIMKAGGAYLPIDPDYPGVRKRYMLEDGEVRWLIVSNDIEDIGDEIINHLEVIDLGQEDIYRGEHNNLEYTGSGSDLLYVIYTSGSTGKPKGVSLEHRNLANLIHHQYKYTNIDFNRVLQFTTISFDVSAQEIFSAFLSGGQLHLVNKETRTDIPGLFRLIERNGIKTVFLPVSFLKAIFKEKEYITLIPRCIGHITTAGEQVVINDNFRKYLRERKVFLHNHYGPSETHVVTALTIVPDGNIPELPSIGKPVMNTGIYIVDKRGRLSPPGVVGEIWIGGVQVGRGYLNRPELTAEKFVIGRLAPHRSHHSPLTTHHSPIYKTGDLARWLPDGNIEFLGRIDHQVKIRGFRVEPGEIESRLLNHPGIKDVVVLMQEEETEDKYLCAYVVSDSDREYGIAELRGYLSKELPDYMIPSHVVRLEKIPLTPNGKVDRKALPGPGLQLTDNFIAPRDKTEEKLVEIWADVLSLEKEKISITENFFNLGGHSLKATVMIAEIHKEFQVKLPLAQVFKTPNIVSLSAIIKDLKKERYVSIDPVEKKEFYTTTAAQKRLYFIHRMYPEDINYNIYSFFFITGKPGKEKIEKIFQRLIRRHEAFRTALKLVDNQVVQFIYDRVDFTVEYSRGEENEIDAIIRRFIRPFDLSQAPFLRVGLVEIGENKDLFMIDMHHIISDLVSSGILVEEFLRLLWEKELLPLRLQYKDYAAWETRFLETETYKKQKQYWLDSFSGQLPTLDLPTDYPRPAKPDLKGKSITLKLPDELFHGIKDLMSGYETTPYMTLLAFFLILLGKYTGQTDMIIGTPSAGRPHADLEHIIGFFVNMLPIRYSIEPASSFAGFLEEIRHHVIRAFENRMFQFDELIRSLGVKREEGRNPLYDVVFAVLANEAGKEEDKAGIRFQNLDYDDETIQSDLRLGIHVTDRSFFLDFTYAVQLFKPETAGQMINSFLEIIKQVLADPQIKIENICIGNVSAPTKSKAREKNIEFDF